MHVSTGMISWKYGLSEASHFKPARLPTGAITNASPDFGAKNVRSITLPLARIQRFSQSDPEISTEKFRELAKK
jgi:hypothetical protein